MRIPLNPTIHDIARFSGEEFPLWSFVEEQGDTALHGHRFVEVAFLTGGEVGHRTPFGLERVRRGDVLVIPEGGLHGYEEAAKCRLINLLFAPHRLPLQLLDLYTHPGYRRLFMTDVETFERLGGYPRLTLPPGVFRQVRGCLKEIIRIEQGDAPGRRCRMMGYLMVILSLLADLCGGKPEEAPPARGGVDRVVRYLNGNFQRQIRLEELARMAAMSENSLLHHFSGMIGTTPMKYLTRLRIRYAAELLHNTDMPVAEVAESAGFADPAYFSRAFRRETGLAPLDYRSSGRRDFCGGGRKV
ncbi:AraC family transcriptional regulator [uncultured Victivallis sp.]|uniref:AraC family transcriptional regulator n=1 Tax=uncultured Victivallis sp. TaxID=354118 RepID=UPI0025DE4078|nr:AraC family transcriptional regulator [uncultured Victivallis sp.]